MTVPLEFQHAPGNLEISSDYPFQAQVTLQGPEHLMQELRPSQVHVMLDLEGAGPGEQTFDLSASQVHVPHNIKVVQVIPAQFHISFDYRATRTVPVQPRVTGTLLSGLEMKPPVADPSQVTIVGPKRRVDTITSAYDRSRGCHRSRWHRHFRYPRLCVRSAGSRADPALDSCNGHYGKGLQNKLMRQLFGTDGIRGVAGEYPLDRRTVYAIGRALGQRLAARDTSARVVIGQDTRESSAWISSVLAAGLEASRR